MRVLEQVNRKRRWQRVAMALLAIAMLAGCKSPPKLGAEGRYDEAAKLLEAKSKGLDWSEKRFLCDLYVKPSYDRLLGFTTLPQSAAAYWVVLFDRGRIAEAEGDTAAAENYYRRAIDVLEQQRRRIPTDASKIGFVGNKSDAYFRLAMLLVRRGMAGEAFEYSERARSRALLDLLASQQDLPSRLVANEDNAVAKDFAALNQAEAQLQQVRLAEGGRKNEKTDTEDAKSRAIVVDLRQSLRREAPEFASLVTVSASSTADIQRHIAPSETWISDLLSGKDLVAFILTPTLVAAEILDGTDLVRLTQEFRGELRHARSDGWRPASRGLYDRLIKPLEKHIQGRTLVIVPYGVLHYVPFAGLYSGSEFLIDRYALRLLPSASVSQFIKPPSSIGQAGMLVFGDPDLGNPALDLQFAEEEARTIATSRPGAKLLLRGDATAAAFRSLAPGYGLIHHAGHATFEPDAPLASGLYMAPSGNDSGLLSAADLYALHLNADLVTLSACETGVGKAGGGDEIIGLTRGFLYAGARNIVTTLWNVDDKATAQLMEQFYRAVPGTPFSEALRQALIATRRSFPIPYLGWRPNYWRRWARLWLGWLPLWPMRADCRPQ